MTIVTRFAKRVLHMHSFKIHFSSPFAMIATSMDQQHVCLIVVKVEHSAFTQASFLSLSDVHKCLVAFK